VISLLGKGGMGSVYEAEQVDLQRRVAVKVLTANSEPEQLLRFKQEALAAAGLAHPNIVQVFDFVDGDEPLLVMELFRGQIVPALAKAQSKLEPDRAVSLMTQVLSALATAHDARIVHRDVKPENIFVCESSLPYELVKVLDFGLARPLDEARHIAQTRMGIALGTPAYMAPEQARGSAADVRMDVFAAGVTLYYALAGRRPFEGRTTSELLRAVSKQPPIPLDMVCPSLDLELVRIVERSLSKDPEARFASAREFLEALMPHWPRASAIPAARAAPTRPPGTENTTAGRKRPAPDPPKGEGIAVSELGVCSPAIATGMITFARFAPDGTSALAIGPSGLARWMLDGGWSARDLPRNVAASEVHGIVFGEPSAPQATLLFGSSHRTYLRARGGYAAVDVPKGLFVQGAHVDGAEGGASRVLLAGSIVTAPNGVTIDDGAVVECSRGTIAIHRIGRGIAMHAVARTSNGAIVACGARGTVCVIDDKGVHAHVAGHATLRAIAPFGDGFVAVGDNGAWVHAATATSSGIAAATERHLVDDDLASIRTMGKVFCAVGRRVHIGSMGSTDAAPRPVSVHIDGIARDAWLGPDTLRVLLDNAAVLEARALTPKTT